MGVFAESMYTIGQIYQDKYHEDKNLINLEYLLNLHGTEIWKQYPNYNQ